MSISSKFISSLLMLLLYVNQMNTMFVHQQLEDESQYQSNLHLHLNATLVNTTIIIRLMSRSNAGKYFTLKLHCNTKKKSRLVCHLLIE